MDGKETEDRMIREYLENQRAALKNLMADPSTVRAYDVLGMIEKRLGLVR